MPPSSAPVQSLCPFVQESVAAGKRGTFENWFVRVVVQNRDILLVIYRLFVLTVRKI